jgi:hypothetical protein
MDAHRTVIWTADASKSWEIAGRSGIVDVNKLLRRLPNELHETSRGGGMMIVHGLTDREKGCSQCQAGYKN